MLETTISIFGTRSAGTRGSLCVGWPFIGPSD